MRGLALGLAFILLASAAGASEWASIRTRAGLHPSHGRLVFDWREKVGYDVKVEDNRLVIAFDKPFSSSFHAAEQQLVGYIGGGTLSKDGRTIRFPLRRPITPKAFLVRQSVVVDLYPSPPAARDRGTVTKPQAPLVKVRAGEHSTYTRFVFHWPQPVTYDVGSTDGDAMVEFDTAARLDTDATTRRFAQFLDAEGKASSDVVSAVRFDIPEGGDVRHFRLDDRIVVDLVRKPEREIAVAQIEPPAAGESATSDPATDDPAEAPSVQAASPPEEEPTPEVLGEAVAEESPPAPRAAVDAAPSPAVQPVVVHRPTGTSHVSGPAGSAGPAEIMPIPLASASTPAAERSPHEARPAVPGDNAVVDVGFTRRGDLFSVSFPALGEARASVFSRAGGVWMVFDEAVELRLDRMREQAPELARSAAVLEHPSATVLRMEEPAGHGISARRAGTDWIVEFDESGRSPHRPLTVSVEPEARPGARLVIPVDHAGEPISLVDPEAGDRLVTVPLGAPHTGFADSRQFPELDLLATAQGIAVVQRGDGLVVSRDDAGVTITTDVGLLLSSTLLARPSPVPASLAPPPPTTGGSRVGSTSPRASAMGVGDPTRLFDFARWQRKARSFTEVRQALEKAVVEADEEAVDAARLDLARFYLARGLAAEALGALETAGPELAELAGPPFYRALRGAANLLAHRMEEAEADLFHGDLDGWREAAVWRAALHAMRGEWNRAGPLFESGWPVVEEYPKWLRQDLSLRAAESALNQGYTTRGERYLAAVTNDAARETVTARARFLEGRILAGRGNAMDALSVWKSVTDGPDQLAHAKAGFAAVELALQEGVIDHAEAIERLERLRFAWRGDALEYETLLLLGRCYLATGDHWNGLGTLRDAVSLFADSLDTAPATELMTASFRKLFVDGAARDLPPLKAVSLYGEFRELTPIGEEGDRVVRDLAGRLVSLDLLSPAAELLDKQVRHRLDGERRADTAADLALVHLLDREPAKAVDILRMSEMAGLPEDLSARRRHLLARGLSDLGDADRALRVLSSDASREADSLRADIYWNAGEWGDAADVYGRVAGSLEANALSEADGRLVLKWGVALVLARDRAGLGRVAREFGGAMAETRYDAAFRMITAGPSASGAGLATITDTLAEIGDFQSYLKGYRSALEKSAAASSPAGRTS